MGQPLTGIGKGGKHGVGQELLPDRAPETLDLAQGHRMMGCAAYVLDPLPAQHLLKPALAAPGHELTAVVREDLPRRSPLADCTSQNFQYRFGLCQIEPTGQKSAESELTRLGNPGAPGTDRLQNGLKQRRRPENVEFRQRRPGIALGSGPEIEVCLDEIINGEG